MLKNILSYIIPIKIYKQASKISTRLEITLYNGKLLINSKNTNYSYGSLQRILRRGLQDISYETILQMKEILVLGVAGGSVIKTLIDEINYRNQITGVEIDAEIISLANTYFQLDQIQNLKLYIKNAIDFVKSNDKKYDLIIIDIFEDLHMPPFLFETPFTKNIITILKSKGIILFNTMVLNKEHKKRNDDYLQLFENSFFKIKKISNVEQYNELIIIKSI